MAKKVTIADLKANPQEVFEFVDEYGLYTYKRDNVGRDNFNKLMGAKVCRYLFREVGAMSNSHPVKAGMEFDTGHTYLVMASGKVLRLANSEWASLSPA